MIDLFKILGLRIPVSSIFLGHNFSLAIAVVVVMMWNFFVNRFWTYSDVMSDRDTIKSA
jgi:putative flippase GtrA